MATAPTKRSGKLITPVFTDKLSSDNSLAKIIPSMMVNLMEIAGHYDVSMKSETFWEDLAIKLLFKHEPSMRIKRRNNPGRKTDWTDDRYAKLYLHVEILRSESEKKSNTKNITTICKGLAKHFYWKQTGVKSGKALQTRYSTAKKNPFVKEWLLFEEGHPEFKDILRKYAFESLICMDAAGSR